MARLFAFGTFVVGGIIVADVLIHPQGTAAASSAVGNVEVPAIQGLLGTSPKG